MQITETTQPPGMRRGNFAVLSRDLCACSVPIDSPSRLLGLLRSVRPLAALTLPHAEMLTPATTWRELKRRQVVYRPGDPADAIFVVLGGAVRCSRVERHGRRITLSYDRAGGVFGESAVFDGQARGEMADATVTSHVLSIEAAAMSAVMAISPELCRGLAEVIALRSRALATQLARLVFGRVRQNLAAYLLDIAAERGEDVPEGRSLGVKITHAELAGLVGAARETVSAALLELRRRGLIAVQGRTNLLTDLPAVRAIAAGARTEGP